MPLIREENQGDKQTVYSGGSIEVQAGASLKVAGTLDVSAAVSGDVTLDTSGVAKLADGLVHQAVVPLTNAEIKALRATPKQLVAAPGAGKMVRFLSACLMLKAGTNVLTESTANLAVKFTNGSGVQVSQTVESTGFIDASVDTMTSVEPKIDAIVAKSAADNAPLVLHNLGAGEIAGNAAADATLSVAILYRVCAT